ncbi:MAG TPA: serine hydrolase domain-containing protein [Solirubrobacterales bacterium]|nr:serine hydrolase domain-containing protein [Solirubrobacterales bacterium]
MAGTQAQTGEPTARWGGTVTEGFEPLAEEFRRLMARGPRGGALVVRSGDRVLADLRIGWEDGARRRPWRPETQALGFSATKGLASMVIHRLADRGLIDYDEPVAAHWPEFAAAGKERISVRELLSHRAGLYDVQAVAGSAEDLLDHVGMERRLAAATPQGAPGRPAYHAITYGWLASGLARAVTGRGMRDLVFSELAGPLATSGLEIGIGDGPTKPAEMVGRSLRLYTALGIAATPLLGWLPVTRAGFRALHAPGFEEICRGPDPAVWRTEMPAVNGALSADGLARLYAPVANDGLAPDGSRFLSPETILRLGRVQTRGLDRVLGIRMRWRLGFHHAFALGRPGPHALGHYGFGGSGGWGDPDTGISFGFVSSHIGNFTTAIGDLGILRLTAVARACSAHSL